MPATLEIGTVLIKEGTLFPDGLRCESESCARGWRLVQNLDAQSLGRKIDEVGWTFLHMDGEINVTVFGFDERKTASKAIKQTLAKLKTEKFNSLEFTRVASVASERYLGVTHLTVCAHPTEIRVPIMKREACQTAKCGRLSNPFEFPTKALHERR
jgi:hypothetical protein